MGQLGFFDLERRYDKLSECGDPLELISDCMNWNYFRKILDKGLKRLKKNEAGRKPYDNLLMFKVLILQSLYNLSDHQIEFQIRDRLSFMRFLGLRVEDRVPDEKTIWLFRERLTERGLFEKLFERFDRYLNSHGYTAKKGMVIDATVVEAPRQRNTREENKKINSGEIPEDWKEDTSKFRQKDRDARWYKKNGKNHFGYKNHISIDVKNKLIRKFSVTSANVHDSQVIGDLIDKKNSKHSLWADRAYFSKEIQKRLKRRKIKSEINRKGYRNRKLNAFQIKLNMKKSAIRARVEHVFGHMANSMQAGLIRCIGFSRARSKIILTNLVYNISRYTHLATAV